MGKYEVRKDLLTYNAQRMTLDRFFMESRAQSRNDVYRVSHFAMESGRRRGCRHGVIPKLVQLTIKNFACQELENARLLKDFAP